MGQTHATGTLNEELERLAHEIHRLQEHYKVEGQEKTSRRRLGHELEALRGRFQILVGRIGDEALRHGWWSHLKHRSAPPEEPKEPLCPLLVFRGRSDRATTLVVRTKTADGSLSIEVDGHEVQRGLRHIALDKHTGARAALVFDGVAFEETFGAPEEAIEALERFHRGELDAPPWEHAFALAEDGLIDLDFGLTDRGRRMLEAQRVRAAG